jgi:hypothetical protein
MVSRFDGRGIKLPQPGDVGSYAPISDVFLVIDEECGAL